MRRDRRRIRREIAPGIWTQAASAFAILVGLLVLVGWWRDIEPLKRMLPGLVAMNPTTALACILAGAALYFQRAASPGHRRRRLAQVCAGLVALVGLLTLGGALTGWDPGLDQLLFREKLGAVGTLRPNRMAPNTALTFLLLGGALLLLDRPTRRGRRPARRGTRAAGRRRRLVGHRWGERHPGPLAYRP